MARLADLGVLTAVLYDQHLASVLETDLAPRLKGGSPGTTLGMGFNDWDTQLTGGYGEDLVTLTEATFIGRLWRFACLYLYCNGQLVWCGRIWKIEIGDRVHHPVTGQIVCSVKLGLRGFYADYTLRPVPLGIRDANEDADPTVTDVVQHLTENLNSDVIGATWENLIDTTTTIGPIQVSVSTYPLDVIAQIVDIGDEENKELNWFGIFDPKDGPYLQSRRVAEPRWAFQAIESDISSVWDGEAYASTVIAVFADAESKSGYSDPISNDAAIERHHGIDKTNVVQISQGSEGASLSAATTYLDMHSEPLGVNGGLRLSTSDGGYALACTIDGGEVPAWSIRCGDTGRLFDLLPNDPYVELGGGGLLDYLVKSISLDIESGDVSVEFDDRTWNNRMPEDPAVANSLRRIVEPGQMRSQVFQFRREQSLTYTCSVKNDVWVSLSGDTSNENESMEVSVFRLVRSTKALITVSFRFIMSTTGNSGSVYLFASIDGQTPNVDLDRAKTVSFQSTEKERWMSVSFPAFLLAGEHSISVYARQSVTGDVGPTFSLKDVVVTVQG